MKLPARHGFLGLCAGAALAAAGLPAAAHHGGGIEYQRESAGPVTGVATDFAFRFPHVQLFMDIEDEQGNVEEWVMVTRWTPTVLRNHGWDRRSVEPGDEVTVTYLPHVTQERVGNMLSIEVNGEPLELDFQE